MILFYTKGKHPIWNEPIQPYSRADMERLFPKIASNGRRYTTVPIHAPGETLAPQRFKGMLPPVGRHWRTDIQVLERWDDMGLIEWSKNGNPRKIVYADEKAKTGKRMQDVWADFKDPQYPVYPTEKNGSMLDKIIQTSSNLDSIVLDCFCGSGTTLVSAERNNRSWIGIDASFVAIKTIKKKLGLIENHLFNTVEEIKF